MKIKIVDSLSEYNKSLNEKLAKGLLDKKPELAIVMTPAVFSKVFSPERVRLLRLLHKGQVKNIYQLAKGLDKPYEVVYRNVRYLEGVGLLKVNDNGRDKTPSLTGNISIDVLAAWAMSRIPF